MAELKSQSVFEYRFRPQKIFITETPTLTFNRSVGWVGVSFTYFIPDHSQGTATLTYSTDGGSTYSDCTVKSYDSSPNVVNLKGKGRQRKVHMNWEAYKDLLPKDWTDVKIKATIKDADGDAMAEGEEDLKSQFPQTLTFDLSVIVLNNIALPFSDSGSFYIHYYVPFLLKETYLLPELEWSTSKNFTSPTTVTAWEYEAISAGEYQGTFTAGDGAGLTCPIAGGGEVRQRFRQQITGLTSGDQIYYRVKLIPVQFS